MNFAVNRRLAHALVSVTTGLVFTAASALFLWNGVSSRIRGAPLGYLSMGPFPGDWSINVCRLLLNVTFHSAVVWPTLWALSLIHI